MIKLNEVSSTNTWVRDHFADLDDGTLVTARSQTAGRGRIGRRWVSPPGVNFTGTVKLVRISDGYHAGAILGLSALDVLRQLAPGIGFFFKWPNDIYSGSCKVAGILCEGVAGSGGRLAGVAAGIGVNINMTPEELAELGRPAASLFSLCGKIFDVDFFASSLEKSLNKWYINYDCDRAQVLDAWRRENILTGRMIEVVTPRGEVLRGIFAGIADDGALELQSTDGTLRRFDCGDVSMFWL